MAKISQITRRDWMRLAALSTAAAGCDRVMVDVEDKGLIQPGGIEPISSNDAFYVYQCCEQPDFDPANWSMEIRILGEAVVTLDASFFDGLEPIELEHTLQCIGGNPRNPLISNAVWGGLPFRDIIEALEIELPEGIVDIRFDGMDDYHTSVPLSDLDDESLWLMWEMNGEPLPFDHGAPCRFICRGRYGTKNVKWPRSVDFLNYNYRGFWESTGWSDDATYRQNGFIFQPVDGTEVAGPEVEIYGTAYAGEDPIESVEISFDEGETWEAVEVYYSPGSHIWTLWRYVLTGREGQVTARVRVRTESGLESQGIEGTGQASGYDGGMQVRFGVSL